MKTCFFGLSGKNRQQGAEYIMSMTERICCVYVLHRHEMQHWRVLLHLMVRVLGVLLS